MGITEAELQTAYEADTALQTAVLSGQISEHDWQVNSWYATRLGYIYPIRLLVPVNCRMLLFYRTDMLKLMIERGDIPDNHVSQTIVLAYEGQAKWLAVLEKADPEDFRDYDQQFMLGHIPDELLDSYRAGTLTCEELMRVNPKAFLPFLCDF